MYHPSCPNSSWEPCQSLVLRRVTAQRLHRTFTYSRFPNLLHKTEASSIRHFRMVSLFALASAATVGVASSPCLGGPRSDLWLVCACSPCSCAPRLEAWLDYNVETVDVLPLARSRPAAPPLPHSGRSANHPAPLPFIIL